ncbi:MAG: hypothetical protein N2167_05615 [Flavobacteriales bacterium]|nr:hypothetical protein [Flavobacteriales bacterium]
MRYSINKSWKGIFLLLVIFILMTCQFYFLEEGELDNLVFNADYIYLPCLYKSLFEDGDSIQSWYLTPAPYFFPDFIIYIFFKLLIGNFKLALIASNAFLFTAITFLTYRLIAITKNKLFTRAAWITGIAWVVVILINNLCGDYFPFHFLFSISNHTGNVFNTLLVTLLFINILKGHLSKGYNLLLFILIVIAIISDNLFILTTIIPITTIVFFRLLIYRFNKNDIIHFLTWGLAITTGLILSNNLRFFAYKTNKMKIKWENAEQSFNYFIQSVDFFTTHFWPLITLLMIAFIFTWFIMLTKLLRNGIKNVELENWILAGSMAGMIFSMVATVAGGLHLGIDTVRYYIVPVYLFVFLALSYLISLLPFSQTNFYLVFVIVFLYGTYRFTKNGINSPIAVHRYTPPDIARILSKTEELNLKNGVTGYWYAKPIYMFSNGKHIMAATYEKWFYPYLHICSEKWVYNKEFTFAVTTSSCPIDRNLLQSIALNKIALGTEDTLWITQPFQFIKGESSPRIIHSYLNN